MVFDLVKKYVSVYVSGRLFSASINLLTILFLVRMLSASDYGKYALLFGLANLLSTISYRCLSQSMVRFYSAYTKQKKQSMRIVSLMFFLLLVMDLFVVFLGAGSYFFFPTHLRDVIVIVLLTISQGHFFMSEALLRAKIKKYFAVSMLALKSVINLTMVLILISHGLKVYGALSAIIIALFAVGIFIWRQCWQNIKPQWHQNLFNEVFKYGIMTLMVFGVSYITGYVDRYLLAFLGGLKSAGIYSAAYDITYQGINMLLFSVATGIVPLLYRTYEDQEFDKFKKIFSANVLLIGGVGLYLCLITIVFFNFIAHIIYGQHIDIQVYRLIPLIVLMCFLMCLKAYCLDVWFQARKSLHVILFVFVVMMVVNIALNVLLIPKFHILGAAWAGVISSLVGLLLTFGCARKQFISMLPWSDLTKLLTAVVVCAALGIYFFEVHSWLLVATKFILLSSMFAIICFLLNVSDVRKSLLGARK